MLDSALYWHTLRLITQQGWGEGIIDVLINKLLQSF